MEKSQIEKRYARQGSLELAVVSFIGGGVLLAAIFICLTIYSFISDAIVSPVELYHRTWSAVSENSYNQAQLKNLSEWEHKFDGQIASDEDAIKYANVMLREIGDPAAILSPRAVSLPPDATASSNPAISVLVTSRVLKGDSGHEVGYIRLNGFSAASKEIETAMLDALFAMKPNEVVLDLRDNRSEPNSENFDSYLRLASLFVEDGALVLVRRYNSYGDYDATTYLTNSDHITMYRRLGNNKYASKTIVENYPSIAQHRQLVVLINANTSGNAEMFAAALRDNHRALIVGVATTGQTIGVETLGMPNKTELRLTTTRYMTPSGSWLGSGGSATREVQQNGVTPDRIINIDPGAIVLGSDNDNQLAFAVRQLSK